MWSWRYVVIRFWRGKARLDRESFLWPFDKVSFLQAAALGCRMTTAYRAAARYAAIEGPTHHTCKICLGSDIVVLLFTRVHVPNRTGTNILDFPSPETLTPRLDGLPWQLANHRRYLVVSQNSGPPNGPQDIMFLIMEPKKVHLILGNPH